jgi:hypothetical protein
MNRVSGIATSWLRMTRHIDVLSEVTEIAFRDLCCGVEHRYERFGCWRVEGHDARVHLGSMPLNLRSGCFDFAQHIQVCVEGLSL